MSQIDGKKKLEEQMRMLSELVDKETEKVKSGSIERPMDLMRISKSLREISDAVHEADKIVDALAILLNIS